MWTSIWIHLHAPITNVDTSLSFRSKDLWKSIEKLEGLTVEVLSLWQQKGIDVIIAPGFVFPAPPVKHPARLVPCVSYTAAYNVLDFPVGSVPITRVIPQDEVGTSLGCLRWLANTGPRPLHLILTSTLESSCGRAEFWKH